MKICSVDYLFLDEVENYVELSYLRKSEIVQFKELGEEIIVNLHHRYDKSKILQMFPELSYNPFVDRMFHVFSSMRDEKMSFEDVLDLASAFSEDCPVEVRAQWAFLMFDFDGDKLLNEEDIAELVTRLTRIKDDENNILTEEEKKKVADAILNDIVLCNSEGITCVEFINEVKKIPEFEFAFRIKFTRE